MIDNHKLATRAINNQYATSKMLSLAVLSYLELQGEYQLMVCLS